jgi:hypothetical protein
MNARAMVFAAILYAPAAALADSPPPGPPPPRGDALSPEDEAYCELRCRSRAGCFDDDRCRVYRERRRSGSGDGAE